MTLDASSPKGVPEIPDDASTNLAEVVQYHRDRDDFPVFFRVFYLLRDRRLAPMQLAYDAAVAVLENAINGASVESRKELTDAVGRLNGEGYLPPQVLASLKSLGAAECLAHAWAAHYIYTTFSNLDPYLEEGVPQGSRLLATYPE